MAKKKKAEDIPPQTATLAEPDAPVRRFSWVQGIEAPENALVVRAGLILAVIAVALRLFYWVYTGRSWEDAYISVLHSENLVSGLGMTHYLGEGEPPLHGFTSPLSVLVPLIGDLFKVGFGISFLKLVSALTAPLVVLSAMAIAIHPKVKLPAPLAVLVMGYLAFEHHQVMWGMAGMETQLVTLVLLGSFYLAVAEMPLALGVSLGFCMLARPDFAFWTVIVGLYVLLHYPRRLPIVVGAAFAVYMPWIIFATWYYGSPIPNTVVAKSLGYPLWTTWPDFDRSPAGVLREIWNRTTGSYLTGAVFQPLGPSYAGKGVGYHVVFNDHGLVSDFMTLMALTGAVDALRKRQWVWFPAILFTAVYAGYYVFGVAIVFGWYLTPFVAMVLLLSARGIQAVSALMPAPRARLVVQTAVAGAYLACLAMVLPKTFSADKAMQERVENPVRKEIGLFLGDIMEKNETVGTEPLGYLGYFSRRIVYDYPGLCSRKVVEYNRTHPREERHLWGMLKALRPDFMVLRYAEYVTTAPDTWMDDDYRIIASFEAIPYDEKDFLFTANWEHGFLVFAKKSWHPEAKEYKGHALGINPRHSRALDCVGNRLLQQRKFWDARDCFRKAIAANPQNAMAHNNLGLALIRLDDAAGALAELGEAVRLDPDFTKAHNSLGVLLMQTGDLSGAANHFREAIRSNPEAAYAYVNLADLLSQRGNLAEARRCYASALRIEPNNTAAAQGIRKIDAASGR